MIRVSYFHTWTPANVTDYEQRLRKAMETRRYFLEKGNGEAANKWLEYAKWVRGALLQMAQKAEEFGELVPGGRVHAHCQEVARDIRGFVRKQFDEGV